MINLLQRPTIRWILTIIVFSAAFHATWRALEYINRATKPTPNFELRMKEREIPSQDTPGFLIDVPSPRPPIVEAVTL